MEKQLKEFVSQTTCIVMYKSSLWRGGGGGGGGGNWIQEAVPSLPGTKSVKLKLMYLGQSDYLLL